jgi:hypothetical protein
MVRRIVEDVAEARGRTYIDGLKVVGLEDPFLQASTGPTVVAHTPSPKMAAAAPAAIDIAAPQAP